MRALIVMLITITMTFTSYQSEWLRLKTQGTIGAGKDVEKKKHSYTVGGIARWYNHSVNQSGDSSENWT